MDWQALFEQWAIKGAMIDGMTALGIQCGHAAGVGSRILGLEGDASRQCGWYYFKRCRDRLRNEGSRVTVDAIRCYIILALFQLQANQLEDAYYMVGLGIRRAHMSNLHLAPPAHLSPEESVGRVRTWWLLYWLDIHCAIQLDRPSAIQRSSISCPAPPDPNDGLSSADNSFGWAPWKGFHPWAYSFFHSKLTLAIAQALEGMPNINFIDEAEAASMLEPSAKRLSSSIKHLEGWLNGLPGHLSNSHDIDSNGTFIREGTGDTATHTITSTPSIVTATLTLGIPDWLQRQRIMLEIQYHNACILLQRPFILWSSGNGTVPTPPIPSRTKQHADSAIEHATTLISMLDCTYSKSDVFDGLPMAFQALWNATATIAAHLLINPQGPQTEQLSQSLSSVLSILDSHSRANPDAVQIYEVSHSLICRLQDATGLMILSYTAISPDDTVTTFSMPSNSAQGYMNGSLIMPEMPEVSHDAFGTFDTDLFDEILGARHG
ncbi:Oosporein cluster regulator OpS3 [Cladobotryum mycophilum]|uniref:Oosporein cluster regulator OpS3 n=1 Tax=Cladobotryum mycophilum TaxID=491253 RepID=A0ABR0SBN2_9HYPO